MDSKTKQLWKEYGEYVKETNIKLQRKEYSSKEHKQYLLEQKQHNIQLRKWLEYAELLSKRDCLGKEPRPEYVSCPRTPIYHSKYKYLTKSMEGFMDWLSSK